MQRDYQLEVWVIQAVTEEFHLELDQPLQVIDCRRLLPSITTATSYVVDIRLVAMDWCTTITGSFIILVAIIIERTIATVAIVVGLLLVLGSRSRFIGTVMVVESNC